MTDDKKTYHIQFPGNIMLEVHLQNPYPVNLTVRFSDNSGVNFSYSGANHGTVETFGSAVPESGTSAFDTRLRPATAPAAGAMAAAGVDVSILYNDPGGSRM